MARFASIACVLVTLAACKSQFQPQTVEVKDPGPPQRVLPTMRVIDPGMTPRRPLRYRVEPGQVETLYVEIARAQAMQAGGQGAQSGIPPVQLEVKMGPASGTPEGFIHHPVAITQIRLAKAADKMRASDREKIQQALAPLLNLKGWSDMDIQGRIRRSEFQGTDQVPPDMQAMLGNIRTALLSVPFPDEPLGVRARWEVERKVMISGVWIDQVVTYDIERMRDAELDLQITARGTAAPQETPNGRLEAYQSSAIGSATVLLTQFAAFSEAEVTTQMRLSQPAPLGDKQLIRIEQRTVVQLYPEEEADEFGPDDEPADAEDAKVVTEPTKQQLKWYKPL